MLCAQLMSEEPDQVEILQTIVVRLIEKGADMSTSDSNAISMGTLILRSRGGREYLENVISRRVDTFVLSQMASAEAWVFAAISRSTPEYAHAVNKQLSEYRTPVSLSSCKTPIPTALPEFDESLQINQVVQADPRTRVVFLESICASGTVPMLAPFLHSNKIDLNEVAELSGSIGYMRTAARFGNLEIVDALLSAGASVTNQRHFQSYSKENQNSLHFTHGSPVDDLLDRWQGLDVGVPEFPGQARHDEYKVLQRLLESPTFDSPNVLLTAIVTRAPHFVVRTLLEAGCGRRDHELPRSWDLRRVGSEVILSIKLNTAMLPILLDYGLGTECEDRSGFTALLHALDRGPGCLDFVEVLICAGANLTRRTASGFTPLEWAMQNLKGPHPRVPKQIQATKPWEIDAVSFEEDQRMYIMLQQAVAAQWWGQYSAKAHDAASSIGSAAAQLNITWHNKSLDIIKSAFIISAGYVVTYSLLLLNLLVKQMFSRRRRS